MHLQLYISQVQVNCNNCTYNLQWLWGLPRDTLEKGFNKIHSSLSVRFTALSLLIFFFMCIWVSFRKCSLHFNVSAVFPINSALSYQILFFCLFLQLDILTFQSIVSNEFRKLILLFKSKVEVLPLAPFLGKSRGSNGHR